MVVTTMKVTMGDVRHQGGSLDIHEESGQFALREAHLHEDFRRLTHQQGEHLRVLDKFARILIDAGAAGFRRIGSSKRRTC
jgi:hypothetical protein